jgi:hypothetical protein
MVSEKPEITKSSYVNPYLVHETSPLKHQHLEPYHGDISEEDCFLWSLIHSAAREILIAGRIITMNNYTGRRECLEPELKLSVGKTNELLVEFQMKIGRVPLHVETIC